MCLAGAQNDQSGQICKMSGSNVFVQDLYTKKQPALLLRAMRGRATELIDRNNISNNNAKYVCGFYAVNKRHCITNDHCVVCGIKD